MEQPKITSPEISKETLTKSLEELRKEEAHLSEAVQALEKGLKDVAEKNPADFSLFKSINGKLSANKKILSDVREGIKLKLEDSASSNGEVWTDQYIGGNNRGSK